MRNEDATFEGISRELSTSNFFHTSVALTGTIYVSFTKHKQFRDIGRTLEPNKTTSLEEKKKQKYFLAILSNSRGCFTHHF